MLRNIHLLSEGIYFALETRRFIYFDIPNGEGINKIMDYRDAVVIKPGERCLALYFVEVSRTLFHEGIIDLEVKYRIAYEKEMDNILCGRLRSNIIQVRVKEELDR